MQRSIHAGWEDGVRRVERAVQGGREESKKLSVWRGGGWCDESTKVCGGRDDQSGWW